MQKQTLISAVLVVLILLAGLIFAAFQRGIFFFEPGNPVPQFSLDAITNPVPNIDREVVFPADFSDAAKELYNKNITQVKDALAADPTNMEAWLDLAIYHRMVGDHEGAIEIWEYLIKKYPGDAVSRHNLAEHYFHNEKNYEKAEEYYEQSIQANAQLQSNYTDLYEMYRYAYKTDTNAAADVLVRGIAAFSGSERIGLQIMLGRHYRDVVSDKENARKYLMEARDAAAARGDRSVASDLTAEINAL